MITIIADTRHIAKRFAKIVGANDEDIRHYVGNNYAVTWLEGIDLGFSPELNRKLDSLSPVNLPLIPDKFPIALVPQKGQQKPSEKMMNDARIISELIADSTYVHLATADLQATLMKGGPILVTVPNGFLYQLHFHSLSAKGIRESLQNRMPIRGVQQKYEQVLKMQKTDWLVSANATHLFEKVYGKGSHQIDRIATPLLSLICRRYKANKEHPSKAFYQVNFSVERGGKIFKFTSDEQFSKVSEANALYMKMRSRMGEKPVVISKVAVKTEKCPPPSLFNFQDILLAANAKFGFGIVYTTQCLQKLFDLGLITWPFTHNSHISQNDAREFWDNTVHNLRSHTKWERMILKIGKPNRDNVREYCGRRDHIGICLTERKCNPYVCKLTQDEQGIYDLIVERVILAFGEVATMTTSTACATFEGHRFTVEKRTMTKKGWTAMSNHQSGNMGNSDFNDHWHKGVKEHFYGVSISKRSRQPVSLHTVETLLMEAELFDLGTGKEMADAIKMLFEQKYIDMSEKTFVPTEKGMALHSVVRDMIIGSPKYMGRFNRCIADGQYNKAMVRTYTETIVRELLSSETLFAKRAIPIDKETQEKIDYIKEKAS